MCDLICDVITCCVWNSDTGKVSASDKITFENPEKKRENVEIRHFYIKLHLKDCLEWNSQLALAS